MIKKKNSTNPSYYIGLAIVQSLLLLYVFYKKKNRKTIFLTFISMVGLAFHFEYPLYILKAYRYKTKILQNNEQDNSFGSVLSQALYLPSAAIFISTFQLGWKIKWLFTVYFVLIERLFLKLNIFKNIWWSTPYTALSIFIYFLVGDTWYRGIRNGNKIILKLTLYNAIHVTYMSILFLLSVFKRFRFEPLLFTVQPWYYHYAFVKVYLVVETAVMTYLLEQKNKWLKILPILLILMTDTFLKKFNVLKVRGSYWLSVFPARLVPYLMSFSFQRLVNHYKNERVKYE
ncbi:hypothetical protein BTR23_09545 [Alkalihalophilus pseudofirmus]|nr:hypothetical protein BTR23_09545 [Alkalihalophilus pseudofirmus]